MRSMSKKLLSKGMMIFFGNKKTVNPENKGVTMIYIN